MGGAIVLGIESGPVIARLVRNDVSLDDAEDLIGACEAGFVEAVNEKDEDDGAQDA